MLNNSGYKYRVVHLIDKLCELDNYIKLQKDLITKDEEEKLTRIQYHLNELIFEFSNKN